MVAIVVLVFRSAVPEGSGVGRVPVSMCRASVSGGGSGQWRVQKVGFVRDRVQVPLYSQCS